MIPRDEEFDVFVREGVLMEVWHGERMSAAQQFGTDWNGPIHAVVHAAAFAPPIARTPPSSDPAPFVPWRMRAWRAVRRLGYAWLLWGLGVGAVLAWGMARGWW